MATKHLPPIRQGDDYIVEVTFPDLIDITGFKIYLTLKEDFAVLDTDAALKYMLIAGDSIIDDAVNGKCVINVPAATTHEILPGEYFYDLRAVSTTGVVETLLPPISEYDYKLQVIPQVTQELL